MPTLRELTCSVELFGDQTALREFGTTYNDSLVETFVSVPSKPQSFSIHVISDTISAPGIAIFVFIDGVYQCNRNKPCVRRRRDILSEGKHCVDLRVRQKEETLSNGEMVARMWAFEKLDSEAADIAPTRCSPNVLENIGCIEVVVLRCIGDRELDKKSENQASNINMDGAGDPPPSHSARSIYDDRGPPFAGVPSHHGPPPPYRTPYAETIRSHYSAPSHTDRGPRPSGPSLIHSSHPHSRYSEPISPRGQPAGYVPFEAFQYGAGPLPPKDEPFHQWTPHPPASQASGVDPVVLEQVVSKAIKEAVEGSRQSHVAPQPQYTPYDTPSTGTSSQPPGAWPETPLNLPAQPTLSHATSVHDHPGYGGPPNAYWGGPQQIWSQHTPEKREARVAWGEPEVHDSVDATKWTSNEDTSGTWDSDDTFNDKQRKVKKAGPKRNTSDSPPDWVSSGQTLRSGQGRSQRSRSESRPRSSRYEKQWTSSSDENDGWTYVQRRSPSVESSDLLDTVRVSRERSASRRSRSKDKKSSVHPISGNSGKKAGSLQTLHRKRSQSEVMKSSPTIYEEPPVIYRARVPSQTIPPPAHDPRENEARARYTSPPPKSYAVFDKDTVRSAKTAGTHKSRPRSQTVADNWAATVTHNSWGRSDFAKSDWDGNLKNRWGPQNHDEAADNDWSAASNEKNNAWTTENVKEMDERGWYTIKPRKPEEWSHGASEAQPTRRSRRDAAENLRSPQEVDFKEVNWDRTRHSKSHKHSASETAAKRRHRYSYEPPDATPKSHWRLPLPLGGRSSKDERLFILPKEPLHNISREVANEKGIEHQVRPGEGARYGHLVGRPEYLDSFEKPVSRLKQSPVFLPVHFSMLIYL